MAALNGQIPSGLLLLLSVWTWPDVGGGQDGLAAWLGLHTCVHVEQSRALFSPISSNFGSRFPVLTDWLPCGAEPYCRAWLSFQQTLVDLADDHYHAADLPTAICVRHISSTYSLLSE